jgi:hypothetical protein
MRYTNISDLYRQVKERTLTPKELEDREKIAKKLPMDDFKKRYGKDAMAVKMAVATNIAKGKSEEVELDEFNKMTVTVNDPKQRKKVFDDLKKQKRLDVSMGPGKTIKVDGKGKALNLFAKDIMNFYDAEIRAEEIEEDAKMAKQSDDNLKSLMKKFRDMEKKDPKMPSTQFMIKRLGKEMKKRGLKEEQLDELRQPFVVIDTARNNQVISTSSDEMGAKSAVASAELPPLNVKDKKTLKIVKTRKKQMIGYPLKEETELDEELKGFQVDFGKGMKQGKAIYKNKKDAEEFAARRKKLGELPVKITPTTVKNANMFDDPMGPKRKRIPEETELDEKYDLYHKTFSGAMQHAYDYAKKKMGITVDPKEIDSKVATGPKKPSEGKTNKYRLKGKGGNLQIQVHNKGGSKPFELNMYKEEFINEDGHADVASAIRQCKTITEDAMQIMSKLQGMNPEESLPTWWTNKLAVASNSMNKMRDYLLVPSMKESLDKEDEPTVKKVVKMLKKASQAHAGQAKDLEKAITEQPEHEITVGNYTTKFFHMCGSAQKVMKKHADKDGAEELTRMQDVFYKMEKDIMMNDGGASNNQKKKAEILYDKIIAKAKEVGIADEVDKYMKLHLTSVTKGEPKLGFGRTDKQEQVSEAPKRGEYALVLKSNDKIADVGSLKDMRTQRRKLGQNKYDVYPSQGGTPGDNHNKTCPPVNEENEMNKDLIDAAKKIMLGEKKTVRQLVDPKKEVMVVKKNNVIVIDKKDQDKYMKMGYQLAEKEKLDPVNPKAVKKKFDDRKDKDIDNDGDVDSTDKYLHKRRKAISKAVAKEEVELDESMSGKEVAKRMMKIQLMKGFAPKVAKMKTVNRSDLEKLLPDFISGGDITKVLQKENYEIGKDYGKHTRDVTPGQSNDDFEKMVDVMQKKNTSMREALAKVWNTTEGKNPFVKKEEKPMTKTMTGKTPTKVEVNPEVKEDKK